MTGLDTPTAYGPTAPVLVTGGNGLVGAAVIRHLVDAGRKVRALVRSAEAGTLVASFGAEPVLGDVMDLASFTKAADGATVIYHLAGINKFCLPAPEAARMQRVNVEGSRNAVRVAASIGAHRLIYTSSAATLGERTGTVGNEESVHRGYFMSAYERSKYDAELAVRAESAERGVDTVYVNPSSCQGPGRIGGTGKIFIAALNGSLKAVVNTRMSIVDIDDAAAGHLLAEANGQPGERYVLNGGVLTIEEAMALLGEITGISRMPRILPAWSVRAAAGLVGGVFTLRKKRAPLCPEMARTLLHGHAYDGSRATRELDLEYRPLAETLRRTIEWYVAEGIVTRPLPNLSRPRD